MAQSPRLSIGLEQDFLPYATGGYYAAAWVGKSQVRARALVAHVHKPSFIVPSGFTNNVVTAYALLGDYFLKSDFSGWSIGGGLVLWNSSIQSNLQQSTVSYNNTLLNGSLSYTWKFHKNFYLSPWAGLHLKIAGADHVTVDGSSFATPLFTPEASVKVGWYFSL
ncbi:MAG: hypothetical protein JSS79_03040 [Bacteroidetes bacterium]|nr:hypothetical protein [Bacteroidota bacterium]